MRVDVRVELNVRLEALFTKDRLIVCGWCSPDWVNKIHSVISFDTSSFDKTRVITPLREGKDQESLASCQLTCVSTR